MHACIERLQWSQARHPAGLGATFRLQDVSDSSGLGPPAAACGAAPPAALLSAPRTAPSALCRVDTVNASHGAGACSASSTDVHAQTAPPARCHEQHALRTRPLRRHCPGAACRLLRGHGSRIPCACKRKELQVLHTILARQLLIARHWDDAWATAAASHALHRVTCTPAAAATWCIGCNRSGHIAGLLCCRSAATL